MFAFLINWWRRKLYTIFLLKNSTKFVKWALCVMVWRQSCVHYMCCKLISFIVASFVFSEENMDSILWWPDSISSSLYKMNWEKCFLSKFIITSESQFSRALSLFLLGIAFCKAAYTRMLQWTYFRRNEFFFSFKKTEGKKQVSAFLVFSIFLSNFVKCKTLLKNISIRET